MRLSLRAASGAERATASGHARPEETVSHL